MTCPCQSGMHDMMIYRPCCSFFSFVHFFQNPANCAAAAQQSMNAVNTNITMKNKRGSRLTSSNFSGTVTIDFDEIFGWGDSYQNIFFDLSLNDGNVLGRLTVSKNKRSLVKDVNNKIYSEEWHPYKQSNLRKLGTNSRKLEEGIQDKPARRKAEWHDAPALIVINFYGEPKYDKLALLFLNKRKEIDGFPINEYAWRVRVSEIFEKKGIQIAVSCISFIGKMFYEFFNDLIPFFGNKNNVFLNGEEPFEVGKNELNGAWAYPSSVIKMNGGYVPIDKSTWNDISFVKTKFSTVHFVSL